ncbi:hypothetical protein [Gemmobacter sp. 24YEA27]|uniref:hypothetical protein n=1 Tax=Gemmobacter sp. 24YEA27 TaxID=3040672 RepID=UPI0024B3491A|nr:hypothetical protein [Gemmobacter sp. 24YEA27]
MARIETDGLGPRELPDTALYGVNTLRGSENSALGGERIGDHPRFVNGLAAIKKAAAQANREIGALQPISRRRSSRPVMRCWRAAIMSSSSSTSWKARAAPRSI